MAKEKVLVSWVSPRTDYEVLGDDKTGKTGRLRDSGTSLMLQNERLKKREYRYRKHYWLASWPKDQNTKEFPGINEALKERETKFNKIFNQNRPERCEIVLRYIPISDPTNISEVLNKVRTLVFSELMDYEMDISLAGGTPQMAAAWYILAFYQSLDLSINLYDQPDPRRAKSKGFEFNRMEKHTEDVLQTIANKQKSLTGGKNYIPEKENAPYYLLEKSTHLAREKEMAWRVAQISNASVILQGETGVGKTVFAKKIHDDSSRCFKNFRSINCAGLLDETLNSELFGHKAGAYTDAKHDRTGLFQSADGGTIFLDEIGDISPKLQTTLLTVLDRDLVTNQMKIQPLGTDQTVMVDVRVVVASNKDLKQLCKQGAFRWDLYYRLANVTIEIPPLRNRRNDMEMYINYFLKQKAAEYQRKPLVVDQSAMRMLKSYSYPGNLRELSGIIGNLYIVHDKKVTAQDLPEDIIYDEYNLIRKNGDIDVEWNKDLNELKHCYKAYLHFDRNANLTSKHLGINENTLPKKIKKYEEMLKAPNEPSK